MISISVESEVFKELQKQADEEGAEIDKLHKDNAVLREEIAELKKENDSLMALAKLGRWLLEKQAEPKFYELMYEEIEDTARYFGLLEKYLATEPCRDQCYCIAWSLFPGACVRLTDKAKVPLTP